MKTEAEVVERIDKLKNFRDKVAKVSLVSEADTEEFIMNIEQQIQELRWVLGKR